MERPVGVVAHERRSGYSLRRALSVALGNPPAKTLSLFRRLLWASWSLRRATAVGKFVRLRGHLRVVNKGRLVVGDRVLFNSHLAPTEIVVGEGASISIGPGCYINFGAEICAYKRIEIGEECRIGTHCIIMDNDFHHVQLSRRDEVPPSKEVVLEPHVWVGNRVTIQKGVRIGYGSVVAAGSVVTKSIPPMSIAGGVPAKVIGRVESDGEMDERSTGSVLRPSIQERST